MAVGADVCCYVYLINIIYGCRRVCKIVVKVMRFYELNVVACACFPFRFFLWLLGCEQRCFGSFVALLRCAILLSNVKIM